MYPMSTNFTNNNENNPIQRFIHISNLKSRMIKRLDALGLDGGGICDMLSKDQGCVMAGSFPLQVLLDVVFRDSDIDFFVSNKDSAVNLGKDLRFSCNLELYACMENLKYTANKSGRFDKPNKLNKDGNLPYKLNKDGKLPYKLNKDGKLPYTINKKYDINSKTNIDSYNDSYGGLTIDPRIVSTKNYPLKSITLQFIRVDVPNNRDSMTQYINKAFDLSFCKVVFDGNNFIVEMLNHDNIKKMTGTLQKRSYDCELSNVKRVKKYKSRGFNVTNYELVDLIKTDGDYQLLKKLFNSKKLTVEYNKTDGKLLSTLKYVCIDNDKTISIDDNTKKIVIEYCSLHKDKVSNVAIK